MTNVLTDDALRNILVAVGANPSINHSDFNTSFEDLDLDSLARAEFAAKIKGQTKVDVEDHVSPEITPNGVRRLVLEDLSAKSER